LSGGRSPADWKTSTQPRFKGFRAPSEGEQGYSTGAIVQACGKSPCPWPVVRWMLEGKPTTERSGVSEDDALHRAREELAQLEAQRVQLAGDVMEGRPGALEEDERLRARIVELGNWLMEAEKEGGQQRGDAV
jgi:hypothetical protein